jgi:hypothetical protein
MKSLEEISKLPPDQYKVIDKGIMNGWPLTDHDHIVIMHNKQSRTVHRATALKFGLCEGLPVKLKSSAGRKPLPKKELRKKFYVYISDTQIEQLGGREIVHKLLSNCLKQKL